MKSSREAVTETTRTPRVDPGGSARDPLAGDRRLRNLLDQVGDGFFVTDAGGRIRDVNPYACEMLGYSRAELLTLGVADISHDGGTTSASYREEFSRLAAGGTVTIEDTCRRKDGTTFPVELRSRILDGPDPAMAIHLMRDVTERIRAKEELQRAHDQLERRVAKRTLELEQANRRLKSLTARLEEENVYLRDEIKTEHDFDEIVGRSRAMLEVLRATEVVAPTGSTVLIQGETGTGKELIARAVHKLSDRSGKPLIKVNCGALPSNLIESELFGHEKGAFTGAISRKFGRFELADTGTVFLDEIGALSIELQAKLLRVLQESEFERLGGTRTIEVDVRVIAATNEDLSAMVEQERFRPDLFYRLNVFPIRIPPLRDRAEDIPLLVEHFVAKHATRMRKEIERVPRAAHESLRAYDWPGNVRELENVIERAVILSRGSSLELSPLRQQIEESGRRPLGRTLDEVQRRHITAVLKACGWRVSGKNGAAEILGLIPTTLESRMKKLGIERPQAESLASL